MPRLHGLIARACVLDPVGLLTPTTTVPHEFLSPCCACMSASRVRSVRKRPFQTPYLSWLFWGLRLHCDPMNDRFKPQSCVSVSWVKYGYVWRAHWYQLC